MLGQGGQGRDLDHEPRTGAPGGGGGGGGGLVLALRSDPLLAFGGTASGARVKPSFLESWDADEVQQRLERKMRRNYQSVMDKARDLKCDARTASYAIALERLREVYRARGIWP